MNRKFLIITILLLLAGGVEAQTNRFRIGVGYQRTWMVDKQASPLKYQTSEKTFLFQYLRNSRTGRFHASLRGGLGEFFPTGFRNRLWYDPGYNSDGTPKKDSNLLVGKLYQGNLGIGYAKKISIGHLGGIEKASTQTFAGASFNEQLFYSDNIVRTGWLSAATVNGDLFHDIAYGAKHLFHIKLSIPLFGVNSRLPYNNTISSPKPEANVKTFFRKGSRVSWPGSFQNLQLSASYEYALNKKLGLGLHYSGQWLRYRHEKPLSLFQNNISVIGTLK